MDLDNYIKLNNMCSTLESGIDYNYLLFGNITSIINGSHLDENIYCFSNVSDAVLNTYNNRYAYNKEEKQCTTLHHIMLSKKNNLVYIYVIQIMSIPIIEMTHNRK